jgi:DNA-binding CsgD family transcriptional regulator/PAS domain-containing protein
MQGRQAIKTLPRDVPRKVRAVEDALAHYSLDGDNLHAALEALREVTGTDKVVLYDLKQSPLSDDLMIDREVVVSLMPGSWRSAVDEYLRGRGTSWGIYNPVRPEPAQRDLVLSTAEVAVLTDGRVLAMRDAVFQRIGIVGFDTMRALVCDGPSMLAWIGIVQPEATTERQRQLMALLLPAFRKRLAFERIVSETAMAGTSMAAALEQVSGAAWVLGAGGRIAHANAAGAARFDADPTATRVDLVACAAGGADPRFKVTQLRKGDGGDAGHLVIETLDDRPRVASDAARRYNLTPAQTRVLEHVARGASNATIAAELHVAERTVEAHVTAILIKAQVASRSALIVRIYAQPHGR